MNNSDRRTAGLVAVIVTTLLCACPGLCLMFGGGIAGLLGVVRGPGFDGNQVRSILGGGIVALCLGVLLVMIPLVIAIFAFRRGPGEPRSTVLDAAPTSPPPPIPPVGPVVSEPPAPPVEPVQEPPAQAERPDEPAKEDNDFIPPAI